MTRPVIGINGDFRRAQGNQPAFTYVAAGYYDCIAQAGGVPMILAPVENEESINTMLDRVDGLVLIGGADLDPRRDGFRLHPTVRPMEPRREAFDRALVRIAAERRIPIFGIGAGMQLLNVSQGGNLFLHLPEDMPDALPHRDANDVSHRHSLNIVPRSLMSRVFGEGEIRVISRHHMAIDEVAPGFDVTARCPDGVIEAIESNQPDWFAIGTQFHPESDFASALEMRIFEEFVEGVLRSMNVAPLRVVA
jgi:putative glutamine amidotransferase